MTATTSATTDKTPALTPQQQVVADTAAALGEGWSATPHPDNTHAGYLDGPDGVRLRMGVRDPDTDHDRVTVHIELGDLLEHGSGTGLPWPHMGASAGKTPEKLARDITNRLLDAARNLTAAAHERRAAHDRRQEELDRITAAVATTLGAGAQAADYGHRIHVGGFLDPVSARFDLEHGAASAQVTVTLPPRLTPALAAMIAALRAQDAAENP